MAVTVDQSKLVLNTFAAIFQNELRSAELVTWKQYNGEMNDRNGLVVSEQVGPRYAVTQTVSGVQDLTAGVQDSVFGSEQFTVNRVFGSSMGWGDFVKVRDIGEARESAAIKNAATQLAEQIDKYILGVAVNASDNWVGTPGNSVATYNDVVSGYTRLKEEGVDDNDLRFVGNFSDAQSLGNAIVGGVTTGGPAGNAALASIGDDVYRSRFAGSVAGIPTMFTQQLPVITTGTRVTTGATMNGAAQNVNYKAVAVSGAPGQYLSQTISITGVGATATVNDGEVFTIAAVNAYDNRAQQSLGRLQQFRVIGNYTATASVIANLRIFPALIVPGSGTGGDVNVNTANATVDSVPGAAAAITFLGAPSTAIRPRAIIQKEAIVVNTVDLIMPATGEASRKSLSKIPLSVRMWRNSVFNTGDHQVRFDVAVTANVRDRRRVVRLNGA